MPSETAIDTTSLSSLPAETAIGTRHPHPVLLSQLKSVPTPEPRYEPEQMAGEVRSRLPGPTGNFRVPVGCKVYKVVRVKGSVHFDAAAKQCRIDIRTAFPSGLGPSGIVLEGERRDYTLADDGRSLTLEDRRFGSRRRTEIKSIIYDQATDSVTVSGEWLGLWKAIPFAVPLSAAGEAGAVDATATSSDEDDADAPR